MSHAGCRIVAALEEPMTYCRYLLTFALLTILILLATAPSHAQQPQSAITNPQTLDVQGGKIRVTAIATGLFHPWSLAFLPDGRTILVTERNGRLRMIRGGTLLPDPVWISPADPGQGADSLHFVAIHPQFAQNGLVYVSYPKRGERGFTLAIARGHLSGNTLDD